MTSCAGSGDQSGSSDGTVERVRPRGPGTVELCRTDGAAADDAAPRLKRIRCELVVRPRPGARDPQADAIGEALCDAGFSAFAIECAGRYLCLDVYAESVDAARAQVAEMCRSMLVNPNLEIYDLRAVEA